MSTTAELHTVFRLGKWDEKDGTGTFTGFERFIGTARDAAGTMVIQLEGTFDRSGVDSRGTIVAGAGTGALREVAGSVPYRSGHAEEYPMVFQLVFP